MARPIAVSAAPLDPNADGAAVLRLFHHHAYELGRGVRGLFLMTLCGTEADIVRRRLEAMGLDYFIQPVTAVKSNIYFGRQAFVAAAQVIVTRPLNQLTPEQDFILGALLGYDREQQCRRFLGRVGTDAAAIAAE